MCSIFLVVYNLHSSHNKLDSSCCQHINHYKAEIHRHWYILIGSRTAAHIPQREKILISEGMSSQNWEKKISYTGLVNSNGTQTQFLLCITRLKNFQTYGHSGTFGTMFWQNNKKAAKYAAEHPPQDHETWSTNGATSSMGGGRFVTETQNETQSNQSKNSGSKRRKDKEERRPKPDKENGRN